MQTSHLFHPPRGVGSDGIHEITGPSERHSSGLAAPFYLCASNNNSKMSHAPRLVDQMCDIHGHGSSQRTPDGQDSHGSNHFVQQNFGRSIHSATNLPLNEILRLIGQQEAAGMQTCDIHGHCGSGSRKQEAASDQFGAISNDENTSALAEATRKVTPLPTPLEFDPSWLVVMRHSHRADDIEEGHRSIQFEPEWNVPLNSNQNFAIDAIVASIENLHRQLPIVAVVPYTLVVSPYTRCLQTAAVVSRLLPNRAGKVIVDHRVRECDHKGYQGEGDPTYDDYARVLGVVRDEVEEIRHTIKDQDQTGHQRFTEALGEWRAQRGLTIVVTHGDALAAMSNMVVYSVPPATWMAQYKGSGGTLLHHPEVELMPN
jgi:broad specificity phosphatase PhoE